MDSYDAWKLRSRDDELEIENRRKRKGYGGRYGTVEYEYIVEKLGKCPCCDEDILADNLYVEDEKDSEIIYHFSCYNYMKKEEENGK